MKTILFRLPVIVSAAAAFAVALRDGQFGHVGPFAKSVTGGGAHLIRRVFSFGNFTSRLSKFYNLVSDESVVSAIANHFEVVRSLNHNGAAPLIRQHPNYTNKYLARYLAKTFDKKSRRDILKFHHQFLHRQVIDSFYERVVQDRPVLWKETVDGNSFSISMSFDPIWPSEGDLSLTFGMNDAVIYETSFTIVRGAMINSAMDQALLVARVHGRSGRAEAIGIATRTFQRIAPPHLLLAAIQSIAILLGIETIGGVRNNEHVARGDINRYFFDYDMFWESFSVTQKGDSFYEISARHPDKHLTLAASNHKTRTRLKRRRLKKQIADTVAANFASNFLKKPLSQQA